MKGNLKVASCVLGNGDVGRPGDVESKLTAPHTEAGVAGLDQRVPEHGREAGQRFTIHPANFCEGK
jgi:hypothetical protein